MSLEYHKELTSLSHLIIIGVSLTIITLFLDIKAYRLLDKQ